MLGFNKSNFALVSSLSLFLCKTLVRSKLNYASSIWNLATDVLTSALQTIQNRSVGFILTKFHHTASVILSELSLNLLNLASSPELTLLCLFQKIYCRNPPWRDKLLTPPFYTS